MTTITSEDDDEAEEEEEYEEEGNERCDRLAVKVTGGVVGREFARPKSKLDSDNDGGRRLPRLWMRLRFAVSEKRVAVIELMEEEEEDNEDEESEEEGNDGDGVNCGGDDGDKEEEEEERVWDGEKTVNRFMCAWRPRDSQLVSENDVDRQSQTQREGTIDK